MYFLFLPHLSPHPSPLTYPCILHIPLTIQENYTSLHRAAIYGQSECVRLLLDRGADKDAKDDVRGVIGVGSYKGCVM